MAKRRQIYKCDACGNIVEVLEGGDGALVCCGETQRKSRDTDQNELPTFVAMEFFQHGKLLL